MNDQEKIDRLKNQDEALCREIYDQYRGDFIQWAWHHYHLDEDELINIYQEAITRLYFNIYSEQLVELKVSLKTYIYAIAKNLIHNHLKKHGRVERYEDYLSEELEGFRQDEIVQPEQEISARAQKAREILEHLGEPCKSILRLAYLKKLSNELIAYHLNYKNEETLKVVKSRCLKAIREHLGNSDND